MCSFLKLITDFLGVKVLSFVAYRHREGSVGISIRENHEFFGSALIQPSSLLNFCSPCSACGGDPCAPPQIWGCQWV